MGKEVNHPRMAPRAKNGTAGSVNGGHAVPNKGQSLVFRIPHDLSDCRTLSLIIFIRASNAYRLFYAFSLFHFHLSFFIFLFFLRDFASREAAILRKCDSQLPK
jgi:hypothetical protein